MKNLYLRIKCNYAVRQTGSISETGVFTIIDYKSGNTIARRKEIDLGMSLQLPLYLYAAEYILREHLHRNVTGTAGIYYTLKSPVKEHLGIGSAEHRGATFHSSPGNAQLTPDDEELQSVIRRAVAFVNEYVDNIAAGNFPLNPECLKRYARIVISILFAGYRFSIRCQRTMKNETA